ncbi:MAG: Panacea domain-containing protein [Ignavibacteria bacterium]|jgi:uncharacterized phage-associated protein
MFGKITNERVGNLILFLSSRIKNISLTKTIKLLYLIDEISVKETGVPVTWLDYKVWKLGPVPEKIYEEISSNEKNGCTDFLDKYIRIKREFSDKYEKDCTYLLPNAKFNDDEFSEYELGLFNRVVEKYGNLSSTELIDLLHKEGTLWDKKVKKEKLKKVFKLQDGKSNVSISFTDLINDELKELAYKSAYQSLEFEDQLT